ncbi:universal stress protein [Natronobacterium texcoconense]|uniref:Nucleotide-binding universal stress protein, UspA family n=1 Tax=Natronobacterium texcoconense TaxID=1095778 RepID=A0A1H1IE12_NATTX|nr:universal stress protein [Natronobacterium texcoconense]SDR35576.1 Nucleotide-binding universal stress protein, UspA family [Natronobacterium texcoconense]
MYRVLLPVDADPDRATEQVETLLSLPGDEDDLSVTILHVIEEIDAAADEAGPTFIEDLNESLPEIRDIPDSVDQAQQRLEEHGIDTDRTEMVGDPADSILQIAEETDADTIVLGARDRTPVGKAVFGSVTQSVILETDRPVLVS